MGVSVFVFPCPFRARLYPTPDRDSGHVQPDWAAVIEYLNAPRKRRRPRLTRRQLWVEYRDEALAQGGTAYGYSQFCARLKARLEDCAGQAQKGDIERAFEKLGGNVAEVKSDNIAGAVAARWLRLGPEARENTGVMAPNMRGDGLPVPSVPYRRYGDRREPLHPTL